MAIPSALSHILSDFKRMELCTKSSYDAILIMVLMCILYFLSKRKRIFLVEGEERRNGEQIFTCQPKWHLARLTSLLKRYAWAWSVTHRRIQRRHVSAACIHSAVRNCSLRLYNGVMMLLEVVTLICLRYFWTYYSYPFFSKSPMHRDSSTALDHMLSEKWPNISSPRNLGNVM